MKALTLINNEGLISSGEPGSEQHLIPQQGRNGWQHPSSYWTSQSETRSEGKKNSLEEIKALKMLKIKLCIKQCAAHTEQHISNVEDQLIQAEC